MDPNRAELPAAFLDRQRLGATLIASGSQQIDVARQLGITPQTVCGWMKQPQFQAMVQTEQVQLTEGIRASVRGLGRKALATVEAIMFDEGAPAAVRLKAACTILDRIEAGDPRQGLTNLWTPSPSAVSDFELAEQMLMDKRRERAELPAQ